MSESNIEANIRRIITRIFAIAYYPPSDIGVMTDDDMEKAEFMASKSFESPINVYVDVIINEVNSEVERRLGAAITKLREAEGIDADQIDQVLGVQEEDL